MTAVAPERPSQQPTRHPVDVGFSRECPKLWTFAPAPSGSGKSFALATVEKMLSGGREQPPVPMLRNAASAALFLGNVEETPRGLWVHDGFGQFLNQVNKLQHMEETGGILLNACSGRPIERRTRAKSTRIEAHALSILGLSCGVRGSGRGRARGLSVPARIV